MSVLFQLSTVPMAVFTKATALVQRVFAIWGGLDATVHSFTVMTYTTVLGMVSVWGRTSASASSDTL